MSVPSPVGAHTELVASTPASGAVLDAPPREVELKFSEEVNPRFVSIALTIDGKELGARPVSAVTGDATSVTATLAPGSEGLESTRTRSRWTVDYRVSSNDGHPVTGRVEFVVRKSATTPSAAASPTPDVASEREEPHSADSPSVPRTGGIPGWAVGALAVGGAGILLLTVLAAARLMGSRAPGDGAP